MSDNSKNLRCLLLGGLLLSLFFSLSAQDEIPPLDSNAETVRVFPHPDSFQVAADDLISILDTHLNAVEKPRVRSALVEMFEQQFPTINQVSNLVPAPIPYIVVGDGPGGCHLLPDSILYDLFVLLDRPIQGNLYRPDSCRVTFINYRNRNAPNYRPRSTLVPSTTATKYNLYFPLPPTKHSIYLVSALDPNGKFTVGYTIIITEKAVLRSPQDGVILPPPSG